MRRHLLDHFVHVGSGPFQLLGRERLRVHQLRGPGLGRARVGELGFHPPPLGLCLGIGGPRIVDDMAVQAGQDDATRHAVAGLDVDFVHDPFNQRA